MGIVPDPKLEKIQFYETHIPPWTANAAAIGLDLPDIANLTTLTDTARAAYDAHAAAQTASRAATQTFYAAVSAMHSGPNAGSDMIDTIKNFAQSTDDPNVYGLAQIPPPAPPGTVGPPGTPYAFRVALLGNGAVELTWKCDNPPAAAGTVYEIRRSDNNGPMTFVDTAGKRKFTDNPIPGAVGPLTYEITAIRSTLRGNPAEFNVRLGASGNTPNNTAQSDNSDLNLAA